MAVQINVFQKYLSTRILPMWTILLMDVLIVIASCLLAYILRYSFMNLFAPDANLDQTILWTVFINLICFRVFHTYSNVLRFSSFVDIMRIFTAVSVAYGLLAFLSLFEIGSFYRISTSVLLIAYVINFGMMACMRIIVKMLFEHLNFDSKNSDNILVYGATEEGINIAKGLRVEHQHNYRLRGFITDDPSLTGKILMGVKVYLNNDTLMEQLYEQNIRAIVVSPLKMEMLKKSDMIERLISQNIRLLTATSLSEWDKIGNTKRPKLKEIEIEDLLQRDPIKIDYQKIMSHLEGKRIMITGAAGSIGSEIMRQVANFNPYKLILIDQAETPLHDIRLELRDKWRNLDASTIIADISNNTRMEEIFRKYRPQYIFHAAAYKHVPMMEDNAPESIQVNVKGTRNLADLAVKYGVEKFVMISTDKAVNPTNVMGCSKRICEIYVQSLAKKLAREQKKGQQTTQFITTRFGNVLGSNGSVIPRFRAQILKGGPVTVTHPDIIRYFMTIPEACRLVLEAGSMGNGGEIYIFDMGEPVRILDLAKRMIYLSGRPDIKIEFTGLRHGEKLYEELLNTKELTKPTYHDKIMIATVVEYDYDEVKEKIQRLIDISYTYDDMKIVVMMKRIVPEFISKNSPFEVLDHLPPLLTLDEVIAYTETLPEETVHL